MQETPCCFACHRIQSRHLPGIQTYAFLDSKTTIIVLCFCQPYIRRLFPIMAWHLSYVRIVCPFFCTSGLVIQLFLNGLITILKMILEVLMLRKVASIGRRHGHGYPPTITHLVDCLWLTGAAVPAAAPLHHSLPPQITTLAAHWCGLVIEGTWCKNGEAADHFFSRQVRIILDPRQVHDW